MTEIEALITAARKYCLDNFEYWSIKYQKEKTNNFSYTYTDTEYNLFPRYNVLGAIIQGIEIFVGHKFQSIEECKEKLKEVGINSNNIFTSGKHNFIEKNAMQEERNKFFKYIGDISLNDLKYIKPLPYKRKLKVDETKLIRQKLLKYWNYDGSYWEPLENKTDKQTIFIMKEYLSNIDFKKIIKIVREIADKKLYLITEDENDYEIEIDSFDLDLYEAICCDNSLQWVVYGSHEGTLAFGGTTLIRSVKELFLDKKDKINKLEIR